MCRWPLSVFSLFSPFLTVFGPFLAPFEPYKCHFEGQNGVVLGSFWHLLGTMLGSFWGRSVVLFAVILRQLGAILRPHFGDRLGVVMCRFWTILITLLGSYWCQSSESFGGDLATPRCRLEALWGGAFGGLFFGMCNFFGFHSRCASSFAVFGDVQSTKKICNFCRD